MQLVVTKSNTLNAFSWIKQGWRLFTLQPGPFMAMSAIIIGFTLLANMNPILGILVVFLTPFLSAGYYHCASKAEQDENLAVTDLFALLSDIGKYRVFIRLATFSVLFSLPVTFIAEDMMLAMNDGLLPPFEQSLMFVVVLAANFMLFAFAIPAAWVAPEKPALELMRQSFRACWINAIPLTMYGLLIAILTLISLPIILVGWLIVYSISVLSFYQMFLTIYQPQNDEVTAPVDSADAAENEAVESDEAQQDAQEQKNNDELSEQEAEPVSESSPETGADRTNN